MDNNAHTGHTAMDELLTPREVADAMRVSEKTVRRLIKRGDLVAYRVGDRGQLRVSVSELERYLETTRVRGGGEAGAAGEMSE
jgi:excisionase family DNA binding protein